MKTLKRILNLILVITLVVGIVPAYAFDVDEAELNQIEYSEVEVDEVETEEDFLMNLS